MGRRSRRQAREGVVRAPAPAGGGGAPAPAPAAGVDPLEVVADAAAAARRAQRELVESVAIARDRGHSWTAVGDALGVSRQAARQRYGSQR